MLQRGKLSFWSHEGFQPRAIRPEKQPVGGAQPGNIPEQNPRGRSDEFAVQHERLLLQAEGAGAQHPAEQEGEQDGNPAARYRLHPGPAARLGHAPQHRQPPSPAAGAKPRGLQNSADHLKHRHQRLVVTGKEKGGGGSTAPGFLLVSDRIGASWNRGLGWWWLALRSKRPPPPQSATTCNGYYCMHALLAASNYCWSMCKSCV